MIFLNFLEWINQTLTYLWTRFQRIQPAVGGKNVSTPIPEDFLRWKFNNTHWIVPQNYQNLTPIGAGSYGSVCAAEQLDSPEKVAIKKLTRPFQSVLFARRAYRELKLLRHMKHDNIIDLVFAFTPDLSEKSFKDVYFVTNLMQFDLRKVLNKHQGQSKLTDEHISVFICQLLRGLKYIHSAGIIHRDLKPENIAVNEEWDLKILDFGLARQTDLKMTGYVTTRYYRAPEIMLNWMEARNTGESRDSYGTAVDIWSVGCIMAEMINGYPIFRGHDTFDQLGQILKVLGSPDEKLRIKLSEEAIKYVDSLPISQKKDFGPLFPSAPEVSIDLLEKMLNLDPALRPTATEALMHSYLESFQDSDEESDPPKLGDEFERFRSIDEWQGMLWDEIQSIKQHKNYINRKFVTVY